MKNDVVKAIYVTKSSMPLYERYIEAIKPLWDSHWLTNMGEFHQRLEQNLAEYLSVPEVSLMVNGHMALEMTIQTFDFPRGSEVITTPFTFISTTHAIVRNGLVPVFCDIDPNDGTIDTNKIEELITPKTVAILPVHVYGNICDVDAIKKIADKYGLKVIYDAAHAFGVVKNGTGIGIYGDASCYSFHSTKVFNTIEGGAVVCTNHDMYESLYNLKNFGIRSEEIVVSVGANAKMNEFCSIMGLLNLEHIQDAIDDRKRVFNRYVNALTSIDGIRLLLDAEDSQIIRNYAYFPIVIEDNFTKTRDELYDAFLADNIHTRKYFYPLTADQACFKNGYKDCDIPIARDISKRILCLPIYEGMAEEEIDRVIYVIKGE